MKLELCNETVFKMTLELKNLLNKSLKDVTKTLNQPSNFEVNVKFVGKEEIQRLNKELRGVDKKTDVLSFPALNIVAGQNIADEKFECEKDFETDRIFLGDMAICVEVAENQAKERDESLIDEINRLFVHSLLHLFGYDHIEDADFEIMNALEKKILKGKYTD